ncbi:MAG TPA: glycosyltransferase family 4 protein [Nitrosomonas sp.]|nr:glycosyltransferase family 4 protein [Nitrosomonas sp.]HMW69074.1 glycosyltransferase family 4 protein [Nitrosomonas sp.]HMY61882.1 glycosyltransferase family 4 protein [Nitrosomonas sp.]HNC41074.1 glycosyltransferase family 4 protein [Nitrosomonas sp.]HND36424.1 glycosyltransferase family 4 protein [Nitrosomonas sp.]
MNHYKMHIGLVGPLPPPSGGMANQTRQLAHLLTDENIQVTLIQVNAPYYPQWIEKFKGIRAFFRLIPYLYKLWQASHSVQIFHVMANSGWSWHLFSAPVIWIAYLRNKPVIINYRGGEAEAFLNKSIFWVRPSLKRVSAIIVPSAFLKHVFNQQGFDVTIVPNIIDLDRFAAQTQEWNVPKIENSPHIILTRNLESIYDNATAIRAFSIVKKNFPNAKLSIAGSGPEKLMLEQLVDDLNLVDSVTFLGRVDNTAINDLYRQADVMINTSLIDNMPISILEALACKVPVVSTNVGGIPFLVKHDETALLVPPKNPGEIAEAIQHILTNPEKSRKMAEAGYEMVQHYAWKNVRTQLMEIYERTLSHRF